MPLNVLVVDNNPLILKLVSNYLEKRGYNTKTTLDGIEALEILSSFTPDIMIVDLVMPGISGDKLCKVIRNNAKFDNTFLAILTATAAEDDIDYLSFGANTCIAKGLFDNTLKYIQAVLDQVEHGGKQDFSKEILGRDEICHRQITKELLEAQKHMKNIFNNLSEGVVELDRKQRVCFINTSALAVCGIKEEEILGKNVIELFAEKDRKDIESLTSKALNLPQHVGEDSPLSINGRIVTLFFVPINNGETKSIIMIMQDITAHQAAKEKLLQSQKMQAIGTLAGGIAHDFNNLLSAILGYTQLTMLSLPKDSEAHGNLQQVMKSSTRATELVKQILAFSRPSSETKMGILIQPLVKEALKFLSHSFPTTIKIEHHIDENCPPIFANATQIQQVVMNLCTNAYHAIRTSGGYIELHVEKIEVSDEFCTLHPELSRKECVQLRVRDTGYGIAPEVQGRIFEPYFTTKETGEGTGLGLAVVHGIVKSHHGTITLSSEVGKGSTFSVYFPAMEQATLMEDKLKKTNLPMLQANIMFIDDDADLAYLGKKSLEKIGCSITVFTSSQKALQTFQTNPAHFDLVITDQTMPELTGFELSKKLLAIRSDLPIILCTGHSDIVDAKKAKSIGIKDFLMKPLDIHTLTGSIQKMLGS